jgi:aminoglycoside phosphotransferase (APT) family kinase protein
VSPEPVIEQAAAKNRRGGADGDPRHAIAKRLGEVLGEPLSGEVVQLSSGASRATYAFDIPEHGRLVLQIERRADRAEQAARQAEMLSAAAAAGVPVAAVVAHGRDDPVLGTSWTVSQAIEGTTDPSEIHAVADTSALIDSIAAALAAVHRMPVDAGLAPAVERPLAELRGQHDALDQPHPTFELAFRALGEDQSAARRTFVHGDFRLGNLMVRDGRVSAVLDWELAHIGDPLEDLGWLCVPAWRFERPERPAAGIGTREQLVSAYERHSGLRVDLEELRRSELAGTLRWGVICVMQAFAHLSGAISSLEHAVIGRRACEVEWDLLEKLDPQADSSAPPTDAATRPRGAGGPPAAPQPGEASPAQPSSAAGASASDPGLHDRPTADELLAAARSSLGEHVLPQLEGRPAFELRVALRALGMVRRELDGAGRHSAVRAAALARLGAGSERELAAAIRSGELDGHEREVCAALREIVRAKLEVANPRYLAGALQMHAKEGP